MCVFVCVLYGLSISGRASFHIQDIDEELSFAYERIVSMTPTYAWRASPKDRLSITAL